MGLDPLQTPYLKVVAERGLGTNRIDDIEVVDLASEEILSAAALSEMQRSEPLMPISSGGTDGYYPRFRKDGSAVPWRLDQVNEQLLKDGKEAIPVP